MTVPGTELSGTEKTLLNEYSVILHGCRLHEQPLVVPQLPQT